MSDWGKGVINDIGWGQGANNDIGWGSIYDKSNAGETLLSGGGNTDAFIIEVKTDELGISNNDQFQFTGGQGDYDVVAKQGGVIVQTFSDLSDEATITFANGAGTYILEVNAKEVSPFTGMRFNNAGDKLKITKNLQWGVFNDTRQRLFFGCGNLTEIASDIQWINTFTDGSLMFTNCNLTSLPSEMTLANLTDGRLMFRDCNLTSLPSEMTLANLTNGDQMFENNTINTARYSTLLVDIENFNSNLNVTFDGGNSKYNTDGETARNLLIANQNWTFTDAGPA